MRTTIELRDDLRARLMEISARRGEKGFSHLIEKAVEAYLDALDRQHQAVREAVATYGSLDDEEADRLEESVAQARQRWRS